MNLNDKSLKIILLPNHVEKVDVKINRNTGGTLEIVKQSHSIFRIEYILSKEEKDLIERQIKSMDIVVSVKSMKLLNSSSGVFFQNDLDYPLVKSEVVYPNEVSEYGTIRNYRIATDIWEAMISYFK